MMMEDEEQNASNGSRQLRARNKNKMFSDDTWLVSKDEDDVGCAKVYYASYNLADKLKSPNYIDHGFVKEVNGYNFNIEHMDRDGFNWPVLIRNKHSLGLKVPDGDFSVNDVRKCVGSDRIIDVIDVHTQKDVQMSMKNYQKYYDGGEKVKLYNVISLEFSHTKLEGRVVQPSIVRKLDWVDLYWPKSLKSKQMDSTNIMRNMMYPKVQKYCLMSVKGCYTDFHVDFGGTSVWYHILKGVKVFWLVRPSDQNLSLYREWVLSDKQLDNRRYTFFGEAADKCERVVLKRGQTFFIPSGWLHAVYTAKDSIVFGGNFLHSYSIGMQIKIARVEDETRVTKKYRYPYFTEIHWYALRGIFQRLICASDFKDQLRNNNALSDYCKQFTVNGKRVECNISAAKKSVLLENMKSIIDYLNDLPDSRKDVPDGLHDHEALLRFAEILYGSSSNVCAPLTCFVNDDMVVNGVDLKRKLSSSDSDDVEHGKSNVVKKLKTIIISQGKIYRKHSYRRRRTRCRVCEACRNDDCGACIYCKDMIKYGGNGRAKQSCMLRQCLQPVLPSNSVCVVCHTGCTSLAVDENGDDVSKEDRRVEWNATSAVDVMRNIMAAASNRFARNGSELPADDNLLMECGICYEIAHPRCVFDAVTDCDTYDITNNINDDLPNSWKCPKCYAMARAKETFFNKQRFFKARSKVANLKLESNKSGDNTDISTSFDENKLVLPNDA